MSDLTPPHAGWASDVFTEHVLAESGKRTMTLSEPRRAEVLALLLAEAARLQAVGTHSADRRAHWQDVLASLFTPRRMGSLGGLAACALAVTGYALFGGAFAPANATLTGVAAINEQRQGVFGLEWKIGRGTTDLHAQPLRLGDDVAAVSPITITYADGSQVVAQPGTHLRLLTDGGGVALIQGEIASQITPSADGSVKFRVESATGTVEVKGTEFRVRTEGEASMTQFTDEGLVGVNNDVGSVDVQTGEQVQVQTGVAAVPQLQVPRISFQTRAPGRVLSEQTRVPFNTRIFPQAELIVIDAATNDLFARYTADDAGWIEALLPPILRKAVLRFSQVDPSGRVSAISAPVDVVVDDAAPLLGVSSVTRDGDAVRITGRTELGAVVRVNGNLVQVEPDGSFQASVNVTPGLNAITIVASDPAGNATTIVQTLE